MSQVTSILIILLIILGAGKLIFIINNSHNIKNSNQEEIIKDKFYKNT